MGLLLNKENSYRRAQNMYSQGKTTRKLNLEIVPFFILLLINSAVQRSS